MALEKYLPERAEVTIEICPVAHHTGWYHARDLPKNIAMLVIDGPPRHLGTREEVFHYVKLAPGCLIAMDDAHDLEKYEAASGLTFHRFKGIKPYALAKAPIEQEKVA